MQYSDKEQKNNQTNIRNHSCTGCYKLRNEVPTERVYLLIENYIQTPLVDPTYSGNK